MISASSIEHILAFDRARWSVMRKQRWGSKVRARVWVLWQRHRGWTLGMEEKVPSLRYSVGMSTPLFDVFSLIEVRFVHLTGYITP